MTTADDLLRRVLEETDGDYDISSALWSAISEYLDGPKKPMTEEEIELACPYEDEDFMGGFFNGVRFAERHHGIGGGE